MAAEKSRRYSLNPAPLSRLENGTGRWQIADWYDGDDDDGSVLTTVTNY